MAIDRTTVNRVRYVLEELLPPALRDSALFLPLMYLAYGREARRYISFRERVGRMSDAEYAAYYAELTPLMARTDLSRACIEATLADLAGDRIADVGCGRGWLVRRIAGLRPSAQCVGIDIAPPPADDLPDNLSFVEGWLGRLPFADGAFDTVVCTHTLEHLPDLDAALRDLRRLARRRLIIVVPREREYRYSFNLHVHFFPYLHTFLNRIGAPPGRHRCRLIGRDIYYVEEADEVALPAAGAERGD